MIDFFATKCVPELGNGSYLATRREALDQRFAMRPEDQAAFLALVARTNREELKGLDANALRTFASALFTKALEKEFPPDVCGSIDKTLALLDPLPAENMLALWEIALRAVEAEDAKKAEKAGKPAKHIFCPQA